VQGPVSVRVSLASVDATTSLAAAPIYFGASVQPLHPSVGDERTASAGICACQ
jgi:hypothetical protein